jgi:hypothetical protein
MRVCGKVLLIVLVEIRPEDGVEKAETCRLIDYVVVLCVTALSRHKKVEVKVKFTPEQVTKTQRGVEG